MKYDKIILILLLLLMSTGSFAQDRSVSQKEFDSIVAPNSMFWENPYEYWHHPEKYGADPKLIKQLLENNQDLEGLNSYYARVSHFKIFLKVKERDSVLFYANKAIEAHENIKNKTLTKNDSAYLLLMNYSKATQEARVNKDYNYALNTSLVALNLANEGNFKRWIPICQFSIAKNHYRMKNDSIALHYFKKVSEDSVHMGHARPLISTHAHMGDLAFKLGKNKEAKRYLNKSLNASLKNDYKNNIFPLYSLMADIYEKEKNQDSMRYFYKKAVHRYEDFVVDSPRALDGWEISYAHFKAYFKIEDGHLEEAIIDLKKIIDDKMALEKLNVVDRNVFLRSLRLLGHAYEKQGNPSEYSEYLETTTTFIETFEKQKLNENLEKLEVKHQTRVKEQSILLLEKNKLQQEEVILQQRVITLSILGLFILFVIIAILLARQRKLKNRYKKINLEQRLLQAQLNPHFIFNTLSIIQSTIDKNPKLAKQHMIKFSRLLVSVFENSALNYVSLHKELETLTQYMDLQQMRFAQNFDYTIELNGIDSEIVFVPTMLLQPFIENSIIHGFKGIDYRGEININLQQNESTISCTIEDNGNGLSTKQTPTSKPSSTQLISVLLDKIKGTEYHVVDKKDLQDHSSGVIITISIPYKVTIDD